ncbi:transglutaminase domain-containing protein, partial [Peribacillus sp. NPDC056705]|uniref:transglutaminase family protein n=1 Tax=Peribacillus sp. NPDC056705 TaxID=3345918 RepID=UPI003749E5F7
MIKLNPWHTRTSTISHRIPWMHAERKLLTRVSHDSILHRLIVTLPVAGLLFEWLMPLRNTGDANADSVLAALSIWAVSLVLQGLFTIRGFVWFPLNVILMVWLCSRLFDYSNPVEWVIQYALHILPEDVAAFQTGWAFSVLSQETRTVILFTGWGIMVSAVHMLALYRRTVWLFGGSTLVYLAALEAALGESVLMGMSRAIVYILLAQGVMLLLALRQETIPDSCLSFIPRQSEPTVPSISRGARVPMLRWSLIVLLFTLLITGATRIWGVVSEPSEGMGMTVTEMAEQLGKWVQPGHKGVEASIPAAQVTGYSSPDKDMGGPLTLSDELYFTAQSAVPTYWRGDTYSYYDGRSWDADHSASRPFRMDEDLGGVLPYWQHAEGETLVQTLTFYQDTPARSLLAGGLITRVQNIRYSDERGMPRMTANRLSETVSIQGDVPIAGYTVESVYIAPQVELLRTAIGTGPHDLRTSYLQLPVSLPERVRDLAQEITKGTSNRYDAALAIENFLKQNYTYSLQTAVPPDGQDFVDDFLFDTGEGYCVHFATAMTVLLRAEGIPARYVTGFAPGERSVGKIDTYEIALKDAHAWVEVYFA